MAGGVAVLYVGAPSEVEMKEKKDRVDDALCATRAAIEEGIIPGGGVAYIRAQAALDSLEGVNADEMTGIRIVRRAIEEPLRQIVANAGEEGSVVVNNVRLGKGDYGYNARTDTFENLLEAGVIDPAKVTRVALENAAINMPEGKVLRTFPSRVTITFTVGASLFRSIKTNAFKVVADYNELVANPSEKCNIYLRYIPHDVKNARININQVDYLIEEQ